jgi:hypothetical protein
MDGTKGQKYKKQSWRLLYSTISLNSAWDITGLMKFWFCHILELLLHAKKKFPEKPFFEAQRFSSFINFLYDA